MNDPASSPPAPPTDAPPDSPPDAPTDSPPAAPPNSPTDTPPDSPTNAPPANPEGPPANQAASQRRGPPGGSSFGPMLIAALAGGVAEGLIAAKAAFSQGRGALPTVAAGVFGTGLTLLAGMLVVGWLGVLFDRPEVRRLGAGLRSGLGGAGARGSVALLVALIALAGTFAIAFLVGRPLVQGLSPPFATAGVTVVTIATLALLILLGACVAQGIDAALAWAERRWPRLKLVLGTAVILGLAALAVAIGLGIRLGGAYMGLPGGVLAALAASQLPPASRWLERRFAKTERGLAIALALLVLCLPTAVFARAVPPAAQSAMLFRAPYLSVMLNAAERLVDRDRDGDSPILFGSDCNDRNKDIHGAATEIPGNGIDENCSGADAPRYVPPAPPPAARPAGLPERMNVLLILVDALRPDHLRFAGYERETSPKLDRFRQNATWFKNAYTTAPLTNKSLGSLLTGLYPNRIPILDGPGIHTLPPSAMTVAEQLAPLGYDSVSYTITYVMKRFRSYDQGFRFWNTPWGDKDWSWEWTRAAPHTTTAALDYLGKMPAEGKPWFLMLHYRCTHDPYYKHEKDFGNKDLDKYDSALHHCDSHIGRVIDAVEARGDAGRTAIFVFSDHGELFGDHGHVFHGETLYEPDVRVLLLGKVPGAKVGTVEVPVSNMDLAPTVLHLAGAKIPPKLDAWSLLPLMFEPEPAPDWLKRRHFMVSDLHRANVHYRLAAVLEWPFKYVWNMRTGSRELLNVVADPMERQPLDEFDPRRKPMAETLESWLAAPSPDAPLKR